jgi:eukaryotic-like serine/threonine-protein kinase
MLADDRIAQWLIEWEEARAANQPLPALEVLPVELRPNAREGLRLLRGFARMAHGLTTPALTPSGDAPHAPQDTPRYRFGAFLARGGMGEVWRGLDTVLARDVAVKVLRQHVFSDSAAKARFEEEARHISNLEHPSIVPVYDLGELADGRPFFVMKLINGQTLAELLAARATPAEELSRWIEVFEQVCGAVAFAHARDVIHRDLKPSNVMLGEFGEVLVMDWGIAKALAAAPQPAPADVLSSNSISEASTDPGGPHTLPGQPKGTPAFMAPEQARGEASRVGKASDVFGLGGILCVILTGQPPFSGAKQAMAENLNDAFTRLDACGADAELIRLAKSCLAPIPEQRPKDAAEVAAQLKGYRQEIVARQGQAERELWLQQVAEQAGQAARGEDEAFPPAAEAARARLRQQALALLQDELATQAQHLSSGSPTDRAAARQVLEALRGLPALAGVQNAALAHLPEPERQTWQAFWREVDGLLGCPDIPKAADD